MKDFITYTPLAVSSAAMAVVSVALKPSLRTQEKTLSITTNNYFSKIYEPIKLNPATTIIDKVKSFNSLSKNWDGYGAVPPEYNVLINAFRFINSLPASLIDELNQESLSPTPYGTIVIDFTKNDELISIEIGNRKIGFFTDFKDGNNPSSDGILFNQEHLPNELLQSLKKLYTSQVA